MPDLGGALRPDRAVPLQDLPGIAGDLVPELVGWPLVVLGILALGAGLRRCPLDPAVVLPLAVLTSLLVYIRLGLIGGDSRLAGRGVGGFAAAGAAET